MSKDDNRLNEVNDIEKSKSLPQDTDNGQTTTRDWNKWITAIVFFFLALITWYIIKIFVE
ncbi:MAG: hypothetical protein ACTSYD_07430 [Candidatus Heimdallarchaeaceae archaeon]